MSHEKNSRPPVRFEYRISLRIKIRPPSVVFFWLARRRCWNCESYLIRLGPDFCYILKAEFDRREQFVKLTREGTLFGLKNRRRRSFLNRCLSTKKWITQTEITTRFLFLRVYDLWSCLQILLTVQDSSRLFKENIWMLFLD